MESDTTPQPMTPTSAAAAAAAEAQAQQNNPSFRRQRASRACETCHARKVRCDAASLGVPCTNCVAFSIECKIPAPKRKKTSSSKTKEEDSDEQTGESTSISGTPKTVSEIGTAYRPKATTVMQSPDGTPSTQLSDAVAAQQVSTNSVYAQFMKPKFARAPIKEAGRVAYLGESSNLSLLVHDRHGTTDVVHYPLPETIRGSRARLTELDNTEIDILHQRGAFLLPPRELCDELVDAFFTWVAPVVPVINRSRFMRRYKDNKNPPSLLLLQAILLAGSRVCTNPQLMDANGSTTPAAMTFYKRAKALFDANYEDDRITIVQSLILMGWYWEGPEDVTKNVFYWSRVATVVAQGSGMHRSVESSQLSRPDKRLWKRIWWTLFTRDRSVAVALGRPVHINTDDSDVEMITEEDFIEDEEGIPASHPPDHVHVQFFLQYVKLCEIMGLVLSQQYSVASKARRTNAIDLTHSDMALADWLRNCPKEVYWERPKHHFWAALLHSNYYTTLCLLHRAHMPPATTPASPSYAGDANAAYPSRDIAFRAAGMITSIVENLQAHDELKFTPAFIVYSLFSALIMHVYQMRSTSQIIVQQSQDRIAVCMHALKDVSRVWLVARMVHTLFESILGNKHLEERLQKAAGKRHQKARGQQQQQQQQQQQAQAARDIAQPQPHAPKPEPTKRKYDDMDMGFSNGRPAPQVSYERSRPQTPAQTPSRDLGHSQQGQSSHIPGNSRHSPPHHRGNGGGGDTFLGATGNSRANTRPTTPFNPGYSVPGSPPDLFLVTRNSPNISQYLWENFQPEQLFPDGSSMLQPFSPPTTNVNVDPQLQQMAGMQNPQLMPMHPQVPPPQPQRRASSQHQQQQYPGQQDPTGIAMQMQNQHWAMAGASIPDQGPPPDDTWSNSSRGAPPVPNTLNVEDWFQFFGLNGVQDISQMEL